VLKALDTLRLPKRKFQLGPAKPGLIHHQPFIHYPEGASLMVAEDNSGPGRHFRDQRLDRFIISISNTIQTV
jgi:hypothetical protein